MSDEKAEATGKPLEKMTVKVLRELAKDIPEITGVHGMKKEELIVAINEVRGVEEKTVTEDKSIKEKSAKEKSAKEKTAKEKTAKKAGTTPSEIKKQIKALKAQRQSALGVQDKKMATVYRRRISRLKKKSRKAAAILAG